MSTRWERARKQPMYLLGLEIEGYRALCEVRGNSGKIYYVKVEEKCRCTCPDYESRHSWCKHIMFVIYRAMGVTQADVASQFTRKQLYGMMKQARETRFGKLNSMVEKTSPYEFTTVNQRPIEEDVCSICLDGFDLADPHVVFCQQGCGKNLHSTCWKMWIQRSTTCPSCRTQW